jgi:MFS superfamily sulfate permease-like transporter
MFRTIKNDLPASIIVFFVALPLCLGIALACGVPLFSGIVAGFIGGIIVGIASGSPLGVSGPAAGLVIIIINGIGALGSWSAFLLAIVLSGFIQIIMGYAKAGFIAYFLPSSVIKGMLTGIGLLIILKQIPHAVGYLPLADGNINNIINAINPGAIIISLLSLIVLILWDNVLIKKHKIFTFVQGPIVVVVLGVVISFIYKNNILPFSLTTEFMVNLPVAKTFKGFVSQFSMPDFSAIQSPVVWKTALLIAIIGSLETLLCIEATDKLDPLKRITPTNKELKAQGLGNVVSGLIGGLPITQVIVRSSANISFGAKSKLSTILHGVFLLFSAAFLPDLLNMIPLASLAVILIMVGYKLSKPVIFKHMYKLGAEQSIPFAVTVIGLITTDLLIGVTIGLCFGIFFTLRHSYENAYYMEKIITNADDNKPKTYNLILAEEVSFFNKASIINALDVIPENSNVIIDCTKSKSLSYDVVEVIRDYKATAAQKNINVKTINFIEPIY